MSHSFSHSADHGEWITTWPFRLVLIGLATTFASLLWGLVPATFAGFIQVLFMVVGLIVAGCGVWMRMTMKLPDDFDERSRTGILLALGSGSALCALFGMKDTTWDSIRLWMAVLWGVALVCTFVVMMPRMYRRLVVSLFVLYHFGGMVTAATAVPLANGTLPWLPTYVWNNLYRHYLTFTYLNNAYHFYSPEPGPPSLVWFLVEFEEGDPHWIRIVRRDEVPTRQQYQRFLSLTESVNQYQQTSVYRQAALTKRRNAGAETFRNRDRKPENIPPHPYLSIDQQFREPSELAKTYLSSYAQYICRTAKSKTHPDARAVSVKVYRLTHQLVASGQLDAGLSPTDPTLFSAYFFGEYLPDGKLKPCDDLPLTWMEQTLDGRWEEKVEPARDPFLYWLLPIYKIPRPGVTKPRSEEDYVFIDSLSLHAGVTIEWELD